ncbi:MAG: pyridoxamine 5'-phosphate oxidase family protein [Pseudomonadota bacterium]
MDDALLAILSGVWRTLSDAVADRDSPLRYPVLGTKTDAGPSVRTVVLREVNPSTQGIHCYSDARASKVADVGASPAVVWLFCDPKAGIQLRMDAEATVRTGPKAEATLRKLHPGQLANYLTLGSPGEPIADPRDAYALEDANRASRERPSNDHEQLVGRALAHFAIVETRVMSIDWLQLDSPVSRRARFEREGNDWRASWIIP